MTRSELGLKLVAGYPHLQLRDVERILDRFFGEIAGALSQGDRVELRDFGAFAVRRHKARIDHPAGAGLSNLSRRACHPRPSDPRLSPPRILQTRFFQRHRREGDIG